jgi:hypothetical protein
MRSFRILNIALLSMLMTGSAALYAQDDKPQEDRAPRQEEPKPQPRQNETKQDEAKPAHPDEAKPARPEQREEQKEGRAQEQSREQARPEEHAAQTGHGQPAGKGGRIPDDKFRAHFGRSHTFTAKTVIVSGQPQFQYSGYSFELVDAWPMSWAYTDDCYIDFIDGEYFLFDLLHPGVRVAVFVVM